MDSEGRVERNMAGHPTVSLEGERPELEVNFTGTAFLSDDGRSILTNRHVVEPWERHSASKRMLELGLQPLIRKMLAYRPQDRQGINVEVERMHESMDIALLRAPDLIPDRHPLMLSHQRVTPGEEVVLLGYPTGLRALLVRASTEFIANIDVRDSISFWELAAELAKEGLVQPLASRGIVAQVGRDVIVYDAETAKGGSGGPVFSLEGEVIAINTAIMTEFGGSNIGIPVEFARSLMLRQAIDDPPGASPAP